MATLNYVTLRYPGETLGKFLSLVQKLPYFNVYKNTHQAGIIFRIPQGVNDGDVCHFFIEHEVNMTNTIKTGTLTMKVQISVIPCHMGLFSGFDKLVGSYSTSWYDEEDYGEEFFIPKYSSDENVKKIVPLPVNIKTNLFEYLDELLFNKVEDENILNKYVAQLGCQKEKIAGKIVFIPAPDNTGTGLNAKKAHAYTKHLFEGIENNKSISLIPEEKQLPLNF
jgi:hypothetical protein